MNRIVQRALVAVCFIVLPATANADWQAVEQVETYAIRGKSGAELYASIGERGPQLGGGKVRTIAHTNFKLTWRRNYQNQGTACTLVSAQPKLIITYTLPKPAEPLPPSVRAGWETFISGIETHERVHGDTIKEMVKAIEASTVGLSMPGDPKCQKIRSEMTSRLSALSLAQRQKSRDFDKDEMSEGGNVHRLILQLVNGS
ncbi:DUF922 domain-containing Zn-dependent protease [Phyllobacterium sp. BT25]|uniref:DUF922 domain-containing Zn-dependent protease n=1 Tax=Phyllobacterium pellucidum TaxID=2740464 RepID=A0A849VQ01_9HYPH|nr:DUF922 domain-containing Zn-dependent protease [Phyllobacterium pellucidum]